MHTYALVLHKCFTNVQLVIVLLLLHTCMSIKYNCLHQRAKYSKTNPNTERSISYGHYNKVALIIRSYSAALMRFQVTVQRT